MVNGVAANRSCRLVWSCYRRNARKGADQYNVTDITGENEPEKPSSISTFGVLRFREQVHTCSFLVTRPILPTLQPFVSSMLYKRCLPERWNMSMKFFTLSPFSPIVRTQNITWHRSTSSIL